MVNLTRIILEQLDELDERGRVEAARELVGFRSILQQNDTFVHCQVAEGVVARLARYYAQLELD